jgi:tetratricopeptide (TPR) repeat protein
MLKKACLAIISVFFLLSAKAQSADSVYNQYLNFNLARFQGQQDQALVLGENLIPLAGKLPEKARVSFYFSIGKLYEDDSQPDKALPLYEKVAAAAPDYYVVHRALGYLYLDKARVIEDKINLAANDKTSADTLRAAYIKLVQKILPHLEKAQACDPSDDTLDIIKTLYKKINDTQGLATLDDRLKQLARSCIDVLNDI